VPELRSLPCSLFATLGLSPLCCLLSFPPSPSVHCASSVYYFFFSLPSLPSLPASPALHLPSHIRPLSLSRLPFVFLVLSPALSPSPSISASLLLSLSLSLPSRQHLRRKCQIATFRASRLISRNPLLHGPRSHSLIKPLQGRSTTPHKLRGITPRLNFRGDLRSSCLARFQSHDSSRKSLSSPSTLMPRDLSAQSELSNSHGRNRVSRVNICIL